MKKQKWLIVGLILLLLCAVVVTLLNKNDNKKTVKNVKTACQIFTHAHARYLLGDKFSEQSGVPKETDSIQTSSCIYTQAGAAKDNSGHQAIITIRTPLNDKAQQANEKAFKEAKSSSKHNIAAYGPGNYWDPEKAELNVFSKGKWYTFIYGPLNPVNRTLSETENMPSILEGVL